MKAFAAVVVRAARERALLEAEARLRTAAVDFAERGETARLALEWAALEYAKASSARRGAADP